MDCSDHIIDFTPIKNTRTYVLKEVSATRPELLLTSVV